MYKQWNCDMFLNQKFLLTIFPIFLCLGSCTPEKRKKEVVLYNQYCASCHMAPKIDELPKDIWEKAILPDMLSRMDLEETHKKPNNAKEGFRPKIKLQDWVMLKNYIVAMAPEKLAEITIPNTAVLEQFKPKPLALDKRNGALITYLEFKDGQLFFGDMLGALKSYDFDSKSITQHYQGKSPITWYNETDSLKLFTEVGILEPSQSEQGKLIIKNDTDNTSLNNTFYRPVHTLLQDLNGDRKKEMVVSEFGDETGRLSLLIQNDSLGYDKKVLLNQPGCIRTLTKDMDNDGKLDLITITSQGNESITILYQEDNLNFKKDKVLQFSPVYGSSWFELVDYNGDGFDDIITVNGDNADKSYVHKPYHGMRIHLNDGTNQFTEAYFYPLNGATRVLARDFDKDGDVDFGLINSFPDYEKAPELDFVYLENENSEKFDFSSKVLEKPNEGRWLLMDAGDIDLDGDEDIFLSSFTYSLAPVPENLSKQWGNNNVDVLILENKLN